MKKQLWALVLVAILLCSCAPGLTKEITSIQVTIRKDGKELTNFYLKNDEPLEMVVGQQVNLDISSKIPFNLRTERGKGIIIRGPLNYDSEHFLVDTYKEGEYSVLVVDNNNGSTIYTINIIVYPAPSGEKG